VSIRCLVLRVAELRPCVRGATCLPEFHRDAASHHTCAALCTPAFVGLSVCFVVAGVGRTALVASTGGRVVRCRSAARMPEQVDVGFAGVGA
jgi:hypothetical protein